MPRVFHLIKSLGRGGAETLLAECLRFSDRMRFVHEYGYFLPWKTAMIPALEEQDVKVVCFDCKSNREILLAARRVSAHLRDRRVDLLHCHLPVSGVVGRLAGKMAGIPVVYTEHNKMERYHPVTRRLNLMTWNWQDRVIAVSSEVSSSIRAHANGRVRVDVVLNGVDTDRFRRDQAGAEAVRRELGIPTRAPVVGTVAVFRVQKKLEDWLEAARLLHERHPDARFLLVGDGPLRNELTTLTRSLGLENIVHFPGLKEDVRPFLAAMDVFMVSSIFEGLPLALLEAMATECAVVATRVGGIPEVIRHGKNGYLVDPGQPGSLAQAASGILREPETKRRIGEAARKTIVTEFGLQRMTNRLEAIYLDVLTERRNGD